MLKVRMLSFSLALICSINSNAESFGRIISGAGVVGKAWNEEEQRRLEKRRLELEVEKMNREAEVQRLEHQRRLQQLQPLDSENKVNSNE